MIRENAHLVVEAGAGIGRAEGNAGVHEHIAGGGDVLGLAVHLDGLGDDVVDERILLDVDRRDGVDQAAEQLLNSAQQDEKGVQRKVNKNQNNRRRSLEKDW